MKAQFTRQYLGVTITAQNYKTIKEGPGKTDELKFHEKHLKNYLRGNDFFYHGWNYDKEGNKTSPKMFNVQQIIRMTDIEGNKIEFQSQSDLNKYLEKLKKDIPEEENNSTGHSGYTGKRNLKNKY